MKVYLAKPRGFCAGVNRAIEIVNRALEKYGAPVYVRHEVVHNKSVVAELRGKGVVFVDEVEDVPSGALIIFSAHGVAKQVQRDAVQRDLQVFDATCPLVSKVHQEVIRFAHQQRETILIGHAGHPEVEGTLGQSEGTENRVYLVEKEDDVYRLSVRDPEHLSYVTQTTLSVDDTRLIVDTLKQRFPNIKGPRRDDICYATQNRQDAVKVLAEKCELILVVGSKNSSNSNRLQELAERLGSEAYLIDDASGIDPGWLRDPLNIGVTSGASAPEFQVQQVVDRLVDLGADFQSELDGVTELMEFSLPRELRT
ncbi:MAG: 4-hydroxy-3-methylbut-2-enyl diphosphate reductase [Gammaproteobacteria bacterium]|nr:4-hydroxy-3-methylbut-2-enyl diphosphate reductase [Gammaproteobacteria bacterium]